MATGGADVAGGYLTLSDRVVRPLPTVAVTLRSLALGSLPPLSLRDAIVSMGGMPQLLCPPEDARHPTPFV